MRAHGIEVPTPGLDDHASLCERVEDLTVEKLIAQPCIEALDEPTLPRTAWSDVGGLGADRGDPLLHRLSDKFGPVAHREGGWFGHAARDEEIRQHIDNVERLQLSFDADGDSLVGELVDDIEQAILPPLMGAVLDEVIRPDMVAALRPEADARSVVEP